MSKKLADYTKTGILPQSPLLSGQKDIAKYASYSDVKPDHTSVKQLHTGFLAQDVEKIVKELGYQFDGVHAPVNDKDHYSLAYSQFIMPLVKGMQEQQVLIEKLTKQVDPEFSGEIQMMIGKQQQIIETLKKENLAAKETVQIQKNDLEILKAQVAQLTRSVKTLTDK